MVRFGVNAWFERGPDVTHEPVMPVAGVDLLLVVQVAPVAYGHPERLVATWGAFLGPVDDAARGGTSATVEVEVSGWADDRIVPDRVEVQVDDERLAMAAAAVSEDDSEHSWVAAMHGEVGPPTLPFAEVGASPDLATAAATFVFEVNLADAVRLPGVEVRAGVLAPDESHDAAGLFVDGDGLSFAWGAGAPREAAVGPEDDVGQDEKIVDVFYATDRAKTASDAWHDRYAGEAGPGLVYGVVQVNIPDSHELAEIERPFLGWRFLENPDKHVMIVGLGELGEADFFAQLGATIAASEGKHLFVFVHGYAVSFHDAALRVGQMAFDFAVLGVDATPVLYSWPSAGAKAKYGADQEAAALSARNFADFIEDVVARTGATSVHVVAHSMGNQVVAQGLQRLALSGSAARISEYVLAAPDIDAGIFEALAAEIGAIASRMTLYAHADDKALDLSELLRAGRPRAGDVDNGKVLVVPGVDSIDASRLAAGFLDHSYFGDDGHALADIGEVMAGVHADQRALLDRVDDPQGDFWRFR